MTAADGGGLGDMLTMSPDALHVAGGTGQVRGQGFDFVAGRRGRVWGVYRDRTGCIFVDVVEVGSGGGARGRERGRGEGGEGVFIWCLPLP